MIFLCFLFCKTTITLLETFLKHSITQCHHCLIFQTLPQQSTGINFTFPFLSKALS